MAERLSKQEEAALRKGFKIIAVIFAAAVCVLCVCGALQAMNGDGGSVRERECRCECCREGGCVEE